MAMTNIEIKDFTILQGLNDTDFVVLSLTGGASGKVLVRLMKNALTSHITPSIRDGVWWIGEVDQGVVAVGQTPQFRKGEYGIEYKYATEDDTAWTLLVPFDDIKFKFDELTDEQKDELSLHFSDLTEEDIEALQQPAKDMIALLNTTNSEVVAAEGERKTAESKRVQAENIRIEAERGRVSAETQRVQAEDLRISAESQRSAAEMVREAVKTEMEELNQELLTHPPYIGEDGDWNVWDAVNNVYVDTGVIARGQTPIIINGTWWIWDDSLKEYVDTNTPVDTDYVLTREKVEAVLTDKVESHYHPMMMTWVENWNHLNTPYKEGTVIKFNQGLYVALTETELPPVPLALLEEGVVAMLDAETYAVEGSYEALGNKDDWRKIPLEELYLKSREGTIDGAAANIETLSGDDVYRFVPNLEIDLVHGTIKGKKTDFTLKRNNVVDAIGYEPLPANKLEERIDKLFDEETLVTLSDTDLLAIESNGVKATITLGQLKAYIMQDTLSSTEVNEDEEV